MTQPEQRQALVDTFINAIYLYDDKVLITFNYKVGTASGKKTISNQLCLRTGVLSTVRSITTIRLRNTTS